MDALWRKDWDRRLTILSSRLSQQVTSAPSGIARLRESLDLSNPPTDPMNIDDYIFQSSTASPAGGVSPSPPTEPAVATSSNAVASAIPIKTKKEMPEPSHFPPSAPPPLDRMRNPEFDYVQRRLRKTSIDETRVSRPRKAAWDVQR